jgi:DNA-binding NarL/FixJ family response regulator
MGVPPNRLSSPPDLFSPSSGRDRNFSLDSPSTDARANAARDPMSSRRHVLPSNLDAAIKQLDDQELERLFSAVVAEQKRRGKRLPNFDGRTRRNEPSPPSLTSGQMNAVRAAFKAGVTPSRIARQFGLSQADVKKALAFDKAQR